MLLLFRNQIILSLTNWNNIIRNIENPKPTLHNASVTVLRLLLE